VKEVEIRDKVINENGKGMRNKSKLDYTEFQCSVVSSGCVAISQSGRHIIFVQICFLSGKPAFYSGSCKSG
jgi:hypothetical protein